MMPFQNPFFSAGGEGRERMLTLQILKYARRNKKQDIQNGGGNGERIECLKGVLLEMCH